MCNILVNVIIPLRFTITRWKINMKSIGWKRLNCFYTLLLLHIAICLIKNHFTVAQKIILHVISYHSYIQTETSNLTFRLLTFGEISVSKHHKFHKSENCAGTTDKVKEIHTSVEFSTTHISYTYMYKTQQYSTPFPRDWRRLTHQQTSIH